MSNIDSEQPFCPFIKGPCTEKCILFSTMGDCVFYDILRTLVSIEKKLDRHM
jgi:hypothetical protein